MSFRDELKKAEALYAAARARAQPSAWDKDMSGVAAPLAVIHCKHGKYSQTCGACIICARPGEPERKVTGAECNGECEHAEPRGGG